MRVTQAWRKLAWTLGATAVVTLGVATNGWSQEEDKETPAPRIEIRGIGGGGFGGLGLPKEFEEMMKAAQEMQELQVKYQASVDELIAEAKKLEQADNLMDSVVKVAKLAKKSEELKADMTKKQEEMTKKIGGGVIGGFGGGFGFGGAIEGGGVKILPVVPKIEIEVDGVKIEEPKVETPE